MSKVYVVVKTREYYDGPLNVWIDNVFDSKEKAVAEVLRFIGSSSDEYEQIKKNVWRSFDGDTVVNIVAIEEHQVI